MQYPKCNSRSVHVQQLHPQNQAELVSNLNIIDRQTPYRNLHTININITSKSEIVTLFTSAKLYIFHAWFNLLFFEPRDHSCHQSKQLYKTRCFLNLLWTVRSFLFELYVFIYRTNILYFTNIWMQRWDRRSNTVYRINEKNEWVLMH